MVRIRQASICTSVLSEVSGALRAAAALVLALPICAASGPLTDEARSGWSEADLRVLGSLWIGALPAVPPSPSNRVANDRAAAELGQRLFFDTALSSNGTVACASCHAPGKHFSDGRARSLGLGETARHAPSLVGVAHSPWFYWDGRRDSLWAQALTPFEARVEMGATRLEVVRYVLTDAAYRPAYEAVFGVAPELDDRTAFPERAGPFADPEAKGAWAAMSAPRQRVVNHAFANVGKAIAAYERKLMPAPARFDRYVASLLSERPDVTPDLSPDELAGLRLFIGERSHCLRCHNGPLFTNYDFHNVGTGRLGEHRDVGRASGVQAALRDEFNCLGEYSDSPPEACVELRFMTRSGGPATLSGAFKAPSLRNVAETAPYMHDGRFARLEDVIEHYRSPPSNSDGPHELEPVMIDDAEAAQLVAFLKTLSGGVGAERRWLQAPAKGDH